MNALTGAPPRSVDVRHKGSIVIKATLMTAALAAASAGTGASLLLMQDTGAGVLSGETLVPVGVVAGLFLLAVTASWKASKFVEKIVTRLDSLHRRLDKLESEVDA